MLLTRIMAFDLGRQTGYAVLDSDESGELQLASFGWHLDSEMKDDEHDGHRLKRFSDHVWTMLIAKNPDVVVWEHAQGANPRYVLDHGKMVAALLMGIVRWEPVTIDSIPTSTWKKLACGKGNATKDEVRLCIEGMFPTLRQGPALEQDVIDAIAVGVAWARKHGGAR